MTNALVLSGDFYPLDCLKETAQAYRDVCSISVDRLSNGDYKVVVQSYSDQVPANTLRNEFLNYLLNVSIEHQLGKG